MITKFSEFIKIVQESNKRLDLYYADQDDTITKKGARNLSTGEWKEDPHSWVRNKTSKTFSTCSDCGCERENKYSSIKGYPYPIYHLLGDRSQKLYKLPPCDPMGKEQVKKLLTPVTFKEKEELPNDIKVLMGIRKELNIRFLELHREKFILHRSVEGQEKYQIRYQQLTKQESTYKDFRERTIQRYKNDRDLYNRLTGPGMDIIHPKY